MNFIKAALVLAICLGCPVGRLIAAPAGSEYGFRGEIRCIEPDGNTGTSKAVVVGDVPLVHTTQIFQPALARNGDVAKQTEQALAKLGEMLTAADSALESIVKLNVYLAKAENLPQVQKTFARQFVGPIKPAASFVVSGVSEGASVAMDAVALHQSSAAISRRRSMAPKHDSNGTQEFKILPAGPKVYVSGMADTNSLPEATQKTLERLVACIGNLGLKKADIVQLKAFLQPMSEVAVVREKIVKFFEGAAPPVVFVEWISPAPNPPIEIELIAAGGQDSATEPDTASFLTPSGTTSTKVFSRVARVNHGKMIYVSGLYGEKATDADGEVKEIFNSLGELLHKAGSDFENLVKATYYVSDNPASDKLNEVRPLFFNPQRPPAASKAKVLGVGPPRKTVTMDMIAVGKP